MLFMALSNSGPPLIFMTTILLGPKSNLVKLEYLDFSNNKLKGEIPGWLRSVQWLILSHNSFSSFGKSWEVSDLTQIQMLELGSNSFRGPLPNWILDHFSGSIPQCLSNTISGLQELNLRHNNFNGVFHPDMFLNTTILSSVDISDNQLEGELPKSLINCTTLIFECEKQQNQRHISILVGFFAVIKCHDPPRKRIIRALVLSSCLRWVSDNGFTNDIPQSLANLTILEALDLSLNQLSGLIPQDLGSLSFLSIINFSHNNLQRPIPRSTQFQRQNCSAFMNNPRLYGLEDICGKIHVPNPTPQESEDLSEPKEQVISWISAGIAYGPGVFCGLVIGHRFSPRIHNWFM
ncbi:hypothetical protein HID58_056718 [Brassica napus]|uniref:Uncharacterized protein n=1 Tax=Brassica napus TaxID=3708 RepID=A0ABQ8AP00_BRANA|nr:hypothetical protein HID58_056718 [Brassica napus]